MRILGQPAPASSNFISPVAAFGLHLCGLTYTKQRVNSELHDVRPWHRRIAPDMLAFALGLGLAYAFKWTTTDLVWSLWLGSLVLGYLTLLSAIAGGAYLGSYALRQAETKNRTGLIVIGVLGGLFFLGFFSLHFCGFHAGHSVFLNSFFPIQGMPKQGFGEAFINPPLLWFLVFKHLMAPYGLFLVPAIIAERKHVFKPLMDAIRSVGPDSSAEEAIPAPGADSLKKSKSIGDVIKRPYVNVIRMHLLIFFFAFCHMLKVDSFIVYAVVYSVYFFPWSEVRALRTRSRVM